MYLIAIDPGQNGGIAYNYDDGVDVMKMPGTIADVCYALRALIHGATNNHFVWVEKVGQYRPGNSGPAAVKFARHCGQIDGILTTLRVPHDYISPSKWMRELMGSLSKDKTKRKNAIKAKMQGRYPDISVTLATADALGILTWAIERSK